MAYADSRTGNGRSFSAGGLGIALAIERKPWPPAGRTLLQAIVGAAAVAIAMSATRFSLAGVGLATLLGAVIGAFASRWTRFFVKP